MRVPWYHLLFLLRTRCLSTSCSARRALLSPRAPAASTPEVGTPAQRRSETFNPTSLSTRVQIFSDFTVFQGQFIYFKII